MAALVMLDAQASQLAMPELLEVAIMFVDMVYDGGRHHATLPLALATEGEPVKLLLT
jgi:hypothetical protein